MPSFSRDTACEAGGRGELGSSDALADLAAGLAAKAGLGTAGALTGKGVGLMFFGPAGAVVFGGVLAVAGASQSRRLVGLLRSATNKGLNERLQTASEHLAQATRDALEQKIAILQEKRQQVDGSYAAGAYVRQRFDDQILYFRERLAEANSFRPDEFGAIAAALEVIDLARRSKVHVIKLQAAYSSLLEALAESDESKRRWGFSFEGSS